MTDEKRPREWELSPTMTDTRAARPWFDRAKGIHVIEYSAYESAIQRADDLNAELNLLKLNQEMEAISNTKSIFRGEKIVQLLEVAEKERDALLPYRAMYDCVAKERDTLLAERKQLLEEVERLKTSIT